MQVLWMVAASLMFAAMGVCVKYAAAHFSSAELVFYRGVLSMAFMWGLARLQGVTLATRHPRMHAWRSLVGVVSLGAWFYAIAYLPLATATTLNYMSSVWIAVFMIAGALFAWRPGGSAEPPSGPLVLTVLTGFVGVLLLLNPRMQQQELFAGVIGLFSGVMAALAYMQVAALARAGEPESRTVFYFAVGSAVAGAPAMLLTGLSPWSWQGAVWLVPIGVTASLGQWGMTRAYAGATNANGTLVIANLQYSGILFAAAFGYLLFDDRITTLGWLGIGLITASGILATVLRVRTAPDAPVEEH